MLRLRDEGNGGRDGIVLNMTMSGDGIWNAVYSVQVFIGQSQQPFMLAVDSGSSDIWIASSECSTSPCSSAHASLYDSSAAKKTDESFTLSYLRGAVSGPIVWDSFKLGPYSIPAQALAAVDQVSDESLSSDFVGLLGLALPPNSQIAKQIPPTESDVPDGATVQQNVFGLTPVDTAPEQRFFSLALERPGSSRIPSLLGIGRHPTNLVPGFDPSKVAYADLVSSHQGDTFWRTYVMSITAWVDGVSKPVQLGKSTAVPSSLYSVALVDTGGPSILASLDIANGIYGAWGIGPGKDGNYYVSCTTPLNISVSLFGLPPIPLHPLDITSPPPSSKATSSSSSATCLGQIQAMPSDKLTGFADIVLGVPFLRNVYTVLSSSSSDNVSSSTPSGSTLPRLGLLPLTDPTIAMSEFHAVRVLGQPLDPSAPPPSSANDSTPTVGKKLSVGVTVLVGIVGFFVACGALFGLRWWILHRRFKRKAAWATKPPRTRDGGLDEDMLRTKRWEEGKKNGLFYAESSTGSEWTRDMQRTKDEADARVKSRSPSPSRSSVSVAGHTREEGDAVGTDVDGWGTGAHATHVRTASELESGGVAAAVPLLDEGERSPWSAEGSPPPHERVPSTASVSFSDDFGMAGVGARRGSVASGVRPASRPRGARVPSGGSVSSTGSRIFHADVGQVLKEVDVPWSSEPAG